MTKATARALTSIAGHRVAPTDLEAVSCGRVQWAPVKSLWFLGMTVAGFVGGLLLFSWAAFALYVIETGIVLLFGHSLGNHRKLVHDSFQCPKWLEYTLVYCGVQVGLAGPVGLLRQHDLRDFAQRMPRCHDYLRHGRSPIVDAWWQKMKGPVVAGHIVLLTATRLGLVWPATVARRTRG